MTIKIPSLILATLLLTGCSSWFPKEVVKTYERVVYPELPPVPDVGPLELIPCIPDRPRIWWDPPVIKSEQACKKQAEENPEVVKNETFQRKCMEYAIDTKSNIIYGFDKEGQECYNLNREKIRYHLKKYQDRLDEVNFQRKSWIERNTEARSRDNTNTGK